MEKTLLYCPSSRDPKGSQRSSKYEQATDLPSMRSRQVSFEAPKTVWQSRRSLSARLQSIRASDLGTRDSCVQTSCGWGNHGMRNRTRVLPYPKMSLQLPILMMVYRTWTSARPVLWAITASIDPSEVGRKYPLSACMGSPDAAFHVFCV